MGKTRQRRLGDILVENGFISADQLARALEVQEGNPGTPLGQVCIDLAYISREQLQHILVTYGKRRPLGEMLVGSGAIDDSQLRAAQIEQSEHGGRLGEVLLRLKFISEEDLCRTLAQQFNYLVLDLDELNPPTSLRGLVKPVYAAQNGIVPISLAGTRLTVALSDPSKTQALNELANMSGLDVEPVLATPSAIERYHRRLYGRPPAKELESRRLARSKSPAFELDASGDDGSPWASEGSSAGGRPGADTFDASTHGTADMWDDENGAEESEEIDEGDLLDESIEVLETDATTHGADSSASRSKENSPVVQTIVQVIISRALALNTSDIHIERNVNGASLRMRVDGVLHRIRLDQLEPAFQANYRSICARVKILCQMDITEKRRPQDGSFRMLIRRDGKLNNVDFRVSTIPGRFGEAMVIRILDQRKAPRSLDSVGLSPTTREAFFGLLRRPSGIILVTGPTGSGKSSTLYAALRTVSNSKIKILTAEDPIEYTHPGVCQAEVNSDIGNTFARYLRAFLRQDPDIIMVGEVRDAETAEMALRAAQTGHLLFSTLHTTNSTASVQRLLDLGMDPNSIVSSLNGVMAQRLMRRICEECLEPYVPEAAILGDWFSKPIDHQPWVRGRGCGNCNFTGFSGRQAVTELWIPTPEEGILVNKRVNSEDLRRVALGHTLSLAEDALLKVLQGKSTLEEGLRVVPYEDIAHLKQTGPERVFAEFEKIQQLATEAGTDHEKKAA